MVLDYKHKIVWGWNNLGKKKQKPLGLQIVSYLSGNEYVSLLCKKADKKFLVLARLSSFMNIKQRRVLTLFFKGRGGGLKLPLRYILLNISKSLKVLTLAKRFGY